MDRKREISNDLWSIVRQVYTIPENASQSDKQILLLAKIVEYIDNNLSTRRKKSKET
jgi:hypothetical protein